MKELTKPKNFSQNLSVKMSNMNMNIKVKNHKMNKPIPFSYWINPDKLSDYTLPTFTKKIVTYLEKTNEKNCNNRSGDFWFICCKFI